MRMPVVQVRVVRVAVHHRRVPVHVDVWLAGRVARPVRMLVVLVVHVGVLVVDLLVHVLMLVALAEV